MWNDEINISLQNIPEFCLSRLSEKCVTWITESTPLCEYEVNRDDVCFFVKTCEKFHADRVPVVKNTWGKDASCLIFFSEKTDGSIPTINLGIPNVEFGHCAKTMAIIQYFIKSRYHHNKNWLVIADDDTLLSVPRLLKLLRCYNSSEAIALGERYGYDVLSGQGYNYITGGGGMVFSVETVKQLGTCQCPSKDSPDDMILGICLKKFGIPITHSKLFHQARPMDYAPEYHHHPPISFHKHWMIDPEQVYQEWLADSDIQRDDAAHSEL
ncbi:beta-1,3-glucosyltransferase-like isoform X1 [Centruroides sculpturatus]|uniref:beta-1,3-glucosyltransferase-like isoform X1 n=1 Tax=Centruroides sculpturatus TaxID=218467 RepID=UPI000C6DCDB5|nr:beta-1,3-glucosyltransferase-like isoform X1 [Centruroides sculpturatus]